MRKHKTVDNLINPKDLADIKKQYPWVENFSGNIENYIAAEYYNRLLKEYIFDNKSDLDIFKNYLRSITLKPNCRVLELGGGTGRATRIFLGESKSFSKLEVVDLSPDMTSHLTGKFGKIKNITVKVADNIDYLNTTKTKYDLVYSLWSFSHSVHQHMIDDGLRRASEYVAKSLSGFIERSINPGGNCFIMHFDSLSEEQRILMKQWAKNFKVFNKRSIQSPSKRLLDKTLKRLLGICIQSLKIKHYKGDPIEYKSLDELLETFLNFHMETEYNRNIRLKHIIKEISKDVYKYRQTDGTYSICPGCFVYTFQKSEIPNQIVGRRLF